MLFAAWLISPPGSAADQKKGITVQWRNGFRIVDQQDESLYYLRLRFGLQFRYTYMAFDNCIIDNADDEWNNFLLRRARLFADGLAPNENWYYFFHLQLEPTSTVNLNDGYIRWQRFSVCRVQFGRMKIPYGLEFIQSAFALNGVERTIFSGETDVDGKARDVFGALIGRFWPGGNSRFPVSGHRLVGTLYPVGGMLLYRSQGINVHGNIPVPGFDDQSLLQYWTGIFNGRDTRGISNPTDDMLYSFRLAYAPFGKVNLTTQGDLPISKSIKAGLLFSFFYGLDKASLRYDSPTMDYVADTYRLEEYGYNLAALVRYQGLSIDLEYGSETFNMLGNTVDNSDGYNRLGARVNIGYFILPNDFEVVFKWAFFERIRDNSRTASLRTGLGLVETCQGTAVEQNLQQYTWGANYYFFGHNQKICLDYSFLLRSLKPADPGALAVDNQYDHRVRLQYQHLF